MTEDREQFLEEDWGQFVKTCIAVAFSMRSFLVEADKELNACHHNDQFFRFSPLHEFFQRLNPRINSVNFEYFPSEKSESGYSSEVGVLSDDDREKGRANLLGEKMSTSWVSEGKSEKRSTRTGCRRVTI